MAEHVIEVEPHGSEIWVCLNGSILGRFRHRGDTRSRHNAGERGYELASVVLKALKACGVEATVGHFNPMEEN
jgi:hypothetical protein